MNKFNIEIPVNAKTIIDTIKDNGYSAYVVGGCVRDSVLGREPGDWDITTSAKPDEVKELFSKTVDTGLKHGTVTILVDYEPYEVTTYRIDGEYVDHRRPESVVFTNDLLEDLRRRDFTINAMAYNSEDGLIDAFDGMDDLEKGLIRCVGHPEERFEEDALRMLRAVRFSAQLNFAIEEGTQQAIKNMAHLIKKVSTERIQVEMNKILISNHPNKLMLLYDLGLMTYILPEFIPCINNSQKHPYHAYTIDEHIIKSVLSIEPVSHLRWTMLFHDIGKPETKFTDEEGVEHFHGHTEVSVDIAKKVLKRLKFDNNTINSVTKLVYYHDYRFPAKPKSVRKALRKIGEELFLDYLKVQAADIKAQNPDLMDDRLKMLSEIKEMFYTIMKNNECITLKQLAVNGNDLIHLGVKEGQKIGEILNKLLDIVIEDPKKNTKLYLLEKAKNHLR